MFQSFRSLILACCATFALATAPQTSVFAQFNAVWQKAVGGSAFDDMTDIQQLPSGGFVICGQTRSKDLAEMPADRAETAPENRDAMVLKTDPQGIVLWTAFPGGAGKDQLFSVQPTTDGGFLCAGSTESAELENCPDKYFGKADLWVVKLDAFGRTLWQRRFGGAFDDRALAVRETREGATIVSGEVISKNFGRQSLDLIVLKINEFGMLEWTRHLGGRSSETASKALCLDDEGNIYVGGNTDSGDEHTGRDIKGGTDAYLVKLNPKGKVIWQRTYGGYADEGFSAMILQKDGIVLAGSTASMDGDVVKNQGESDVWLVSVSHDGYLRWNQTFGGSKTDEASALTALENGGFVIAGGSRSGDGDVSALHGNLQNPDAWLAQFNETGGLVWQKTFGGLQNDHFSAIAPLTDGGFAVLGFTESYDIEGLKVKGFRDGWMMRFADAAPATDRENMVNRVIIWPNPTTNEFYFDLKCAGECVLEALWFTDASGKVVFYQTDPTSPVYFGHLPTGLYFVNFKVQGKYVPAQRIVVSGN